MCKWKDGKYQCVCATNGIDYCTGEHAECRKIGGRWTCICVDGYQGYHGDCRGLVLKNVYSMMYSFLLINHNINCLTLTSSHNRSHCYVMAECTMPPCNSHNYISAISGPPSLNSSSLYPISHFPLLFFKLHPFKWLSVHICKHHPIYALYVCFIHRRGTCFCQTTFPK